MSSAHHVPSSTVTTAERWVMALSWLNLVALGVLCVLLFMVSEGWWFSTILTYAPRLPYLAPTLGLLMAAAFWHRPSLWINCASLLVVLGPVMGLSLPVSRLLGPAPADEGSFRLTVVSCNTQAFQPDFSRVLDEILPLRPDVVALQEAFPLSPLLDEAFRDWHTVSYDRYWVGSRYPLKIVAKCEIELYERSAGMVVEIETPSGPVVLGDIHQMTARWGLRELTRHSLLNGEGPRRLAEQEEKRGEESLAIRDYIESARGDKPLLVVGDLNTPSSSSLYQQHWGDLQNAFDQAGVGYGYTSPCKANRFWPENLPWARIDHILCSPEWRVDSCRIGRSAGSDHRMIAATLTLAVPSQQPMSDVLVGLE